MDALVCDKCGKKINLDYRLYMELGKGAWNGIEYESLNEHHDLCGPCLVRILNDAMQHHSRKGHCEINQKFSIDFLAKGK